MIGTWPAAAHGWRVFVPVIVINAAVQAATVISDPVPAATVQFAALLAVSTLSVIVAIWLVFAGARAAVHEVRGWRARWLLLLWAAISVVATVVASLIIGALAIVPLLAALIVLSTVADGASPQTAFRGIARAPLAYSVSLVVALVVIALCWVAALLLGFLVTGVASAFATWLLFGAVAVVLACRFSVLRARVATN